MSKTKNPKNGKKDKELKTEIVTKTEDKDTKTVKPAAAATNPTEEVKNIPAPEEVKNIPAPTEETEVTPTEEVKNIPAPTETETETEEVKNIPEPTETETETEEVKNIPEPTETETEVTPTEEVKNPTETEEVMSEGMPPMFAFSYATTIKDDLVAGAVVTVEQAKEVVETLAKNRSAFLTGKQKAGDLEQYDALVKVITEKIESKLGAVSNLPDVTPTPVLGPEALTPAASALAAPATTKSPQELVDAGLKKIVDYMTKFKSERLCHQQHVKDFCKQNSTDGFVYEFTGSEINASYFGGKYTASAAFSV